ncbi:hypothetical protein OSI25_14920, partial [Mycobacterium ulcerans]
PARGGGAARSAVATGADQLGPAAVAAVPAITAHAWPTAAPGGTDGTAGAAGKGGVLFGTDGATG